MLLLVLRDARNPLQSSLLLRPSSLSSLAVSLILLKLRSLLLLVRKTRELKLLASYNYISVTFYKKRTAE